MLIADGDLALQDTAVRYGYFPTQDKECDAIFPIDPEQICVTLPDEFKISSMREDYDLHRYGRVMWKGFNHEADGEGPYRFTRERAEALALEFERPNVNLDIKIVVISPGGDFVSYCGMWHDSRSQTTLVEPVATDPAYRRMGLGKAAVLEGIRRCGILGAKRAFVGSSQQFYYNIGFRPYAASTWWAKKVEI